MEIILIAAMASNRVIGKGNDIPWHIPGEQQRFKKITWGHPLIMGRKTYESIGHPLPGRRNIVVTRNETYEAPGCEIVNSLDSALSLCEDEVKVFIIGGAQLYELSLARATSLILTVLDRKVDGDIFFPEFSENDYSIVKSESVTEPERYVVFWYTKKVAGFMV
jgi:dihydrofolate reductase